MLEEVTAQGLGRLHTLDGCIGVDIETASGKDIIDILGSLPNIALDIHGQTRSFRNNKSEIGVIALLVSKTTTWDDQDKAHQAGLASGLITTYMLACRRRRWWWWWQLLAHSQMRHGQHLGAFRGRRFLSM